jgi:hypothetical protein
MNEKYYRITWEKFDPVDFKTTFVLCEEPIKKSFLDINNVKFMNEILKYINVK